MCKCKKFRSRCSACNPVINYRILFQSLDRPLCACGCGTDLPLQKYYSDEIKFIHGHNNKGIHWSDEVKKKHSISALGNTHSKGVIKSLETREKLRIANLGKKQTPEHRLNSSLGHKGQKVWSEGYTKDTHPSIKRFSDWRKTQSPPSLGKKYGDDVKEKHRIIGKRLWENPEYVANYKAKRKSQILPLKDTSIEVKVQAQLKELGYDFFTHQYMSEITHSYQCDIFVPSLNLVIECDGNYWHKYPVGNDIDHVRTSELIAKGFKVLRLWEIEIRQMSVKDLKNRMDELAK